MNKKEAKRILHEAFGNYIDKGRELLFSCPSCRHHKRKLSINLDKNAFKCWICDYHGRNIRRLVRRHGTYSQLQKWEAISGRSDLERFADLFVERGFEEDKTKVELPLEFLSLATKNVPATGRQAKKYLRSRGVTDADMVRWKMGYCFSGEYRNRVIIPSFDDDGDVSYFIARSYNGDSYKYKNPKASKNIVFNELFINWNDDLTIVEGVLMPLWQEMLPPSWVPLSVQIHDLSKISCTTTPPSISPSIQTQPTKKEGLFKRFLNMISNYIRST